MEIETLKGEPPAGDSADIMRRVKEIVGVRIQAPFSCAGYHVVRSGRQTPRPGPVPHHAFGTQGTRHVDARRYAPEAGKEPFLPSGIGIR